MKKVFLVLLTGMISLGLLGITACSGNESAGSATFAFDASVLGRLRSDVLRSARAGAVLDVESDTLADDVDTTAYGDEVESVTAKIIVSLVGDYTAKQSIDVSKYIEQLQDDNASKNDTSNIEETITFDGIPVGSQVYATADVYATVTYTEAYRATLKDTLAYFESLDSTDKEVARWISYAKGIVENGTSTEHLYTGTSETVTIESGDNPMEISLVEVEEDYPEEPEIKTEQTYIVEYWLQKADATDTSDDAYELDKTRTISDTTTDFSENLENLLTAYKTEIENYTYSGFGTQHDSESGVYYLHLYYDKEKIAQETKIVYTVESWLRDTEADEYVLDSERTTSPETISSEDELKEKFNAETIAETYSVPGYTYTTWIPDQSTDNDGTTVITVKLYYTKTAQEPIEPPEPQDLTIAITVQYQYESPDDTYETAADDTISITLTAEDSAAEKIAEAIEEQVLPKVDEKAPEGFAYKDYELSVVPPVVTIRFERKTIRYTFNLDGGTTKTSLAENESGLYVTGKYGTAVQAIDDPTKDGYTFSGWKNAAGETVTLPAIFGTEDETFTAVYTEIPIVEPEPTKEVVLTATGTATYPYFNTYLTIPFTLYAYGDGTYTISCDGYASLIAPNTVVSEGTYQQTGKNTIIITEATYTNPVTMKTESVTNPSAKEITIQNGTFTVDSGTGLAITFTVEGYESEEPAAVSTDITITTPTYATGSITIKPTSTTTEAGEEINTYTATSGYTTYVWFVDGKPVSASDEGVTVSENTLSLVKGAGVQTIMVVADSTDSATMTVNE